MIPPAVIDAVRKASQQAQREAGAFVVPNPGKSVSISEDACPYCGQADQHKVSCKLWMFTPAQWKALYGYPVCECHQLPDGKERDKLHTKEFNARVKAIFR